MRNTVLPLCSESVAGIGIAASPQRRMYAVDAETVAGSSGLLNRTVTTVFNGSPELLSGFAETTAGAVAVRSGATRKLV